MTPSNNRTALLAAAYSLAGREGSAAVTLEGVANEAGMSKSGVIYHFRSKDVLLAGLMQYLTDRWEQQLIGRLPVPPQDSDVAERVSAYVTVAADRTNGPTAADLAVIVDGSAREHLLAIWQELVDRWVPVRELTAAQHVAVMAADGIWLGHALGARATPDTTMDLLFALIGDDK